MTEAWRVATAQATNEKVRLFSRLGRLVLDPDIPDEQLRRRIFEEVASRELFAATVEETEQLLRPRDGSYLDFVENRKVTAVSNVSSKSSMNNCSGWHCQRKSAGLSSPPTTGN